MQILRFVYASRAVRWNRVRLLIHLPNLVLQMHNFDHKDSLVRLLKLILMVMCSQVYLSLTFPGSVYS